MFRPGEVLGPYRIVRPIAKGGTAAVYEAVHTAIGRQVAIKVLAQECASDPQARRRLYAEAKALNRIHDDHVVAVTDLIEGGERSSLVMEYLSGHTLEIELAGGGALELERLLSIASQVAGAMSAAHAVGIIHRDLKPSNIYLCARADERDFVKLLDFGAANLEMTDREIRPEIIGTPLYIAPEVWAGLPGDHRADVYSLGAVLYEAATGRPPFDHQRIQDLRVAHASRAPVPPSRRAGAICPFPRRLELLILRCLEKDPRDRPESMDVIQAEIAAIAAKPALPAPVTTCSLPDRGDERAVTGSLPGRPKPRFEAWSGQTRALAVAACLLLGLSILHRVQTEADAGGSTPRSAPVTIARVASGHPVPAPMLATLPAARVEADREAVDRDDADLAPPTATPEARTPRPAAERAKPRARRRSAARSPTQPPAVAPSVSVAKTTPPSQPPPIRRVVTGARPRPSRLEWLAAVAERDRARRSRALSL